MWHFSEKAKTPHVIKEEEEMLNKTFNYRNVITSVLEGRSSATYSYRVPSAQKHARNPGKYLHLSGGVSVMVCAVNSSSKYLVSVSDVTCGLKSGVS